MKMEMQSRLWLAVIILLSVGALSDLVLLTVKQKWFLS